MHRPLVALLVIVLALPASAALPALPLLGRVVAVDAGHGGADPGARDFYAANGEACPWVDCPDEAELNLRAALVAQQLLEARGAEVVMTRTSDATVTLAQRVAAANGAGADLFVSIHHNSCCGGEGTETFYWGEGATYSVQGKALASELQSRVVDAVGTRDRGIHADKDWLGYHLYVLSRTAMPAALVEVAFMDDQEDYDTAVLPTTSVLVGEAVASAIEARLA